MITTFRVLAHSQFHPHSSMLPEPVFAMDLPWPVVAQPILFGHPSVPDKTTALSFRSSRPKERPSITTRPLDTRPVTCGQSISRVPYQRRFRPLAPVSGRWRSSSTSEPPGGGACYWRFKHGVFRNTRENGEVNFGKQECCDAPLTPAPQKLTSPPAVRNANFQYIPKTGLAKPSSKSVDGISDATFKGLKRLQEMDEIIGLGCKYIFGINNTVHGMTSDFMDVMCVPHCFTEPDGFVDLAGA
nr:hypothetical protein Iba_chr08dCG9630 [Ipomoea batatas]